MRIFTCGFYDLYADLMTTLPAKHVVLLYLTSKEIMRCIDNNARCSDIIKSRVNQARSSYRKILGKAGFEFQKLKLMNTPPLSDMQLLSLYTFRKCTMCWSNPLNKTALPVIVGFGQRLCLSCCTSFTLEQSVVKDVYKLSLEDCVHLPHLIVVWEDQRSESRVFLKSDIEEIAGQHLSADEVTMKLRQAHYECIINKFTTLCFARLQSRIENFQAIFEQLQLYQSTRQNQRASRR